ncbi:MAG: NACHT domain-containing protein [Planktothrix sp.]
MPQQQNESLEDEAQIPQEYDLDKICQELLNPEETEEGTDSRPLAAIIGEAGAGKSTLLHNIGEWVDRQTETDVPILVSLRSIGDKQLYDYLIEDWLRDAAGEAEAASEEWKQAFNELLKSRRVWLLLDGADEMGVDSPLAKIADQLREGWPNNLRVVLTCRMNVWDAGNNYLEGFRTYKTLPLTYGDADTPDRVGEFITKWFKPNPERGKKLRSELDNPQKTRIKDLVKNPLRLALLCYTWQLNEGELPETKAELYSQFVNLIYQWKDNTFPIHKLNQTLGQLALESLNSSSSRFCLRESVVRGVLEKSQPELFKFAINSGWLNRIGVTGEKPREDAYAFFHPTFQEYFAALAIGEDWTYFLNHTPEDPSQGTYRIFEPQWKEVFLLWMGLKSDESSSVSNEEQKENFIEALLQFKTQIKFYRLIVYLIACQGIAELRESRFTTDIVETLVAFGFGSPTKNMGEWINKNTSELINKNASELKRRFRWGKTAARTALKTTNHSQVIEGLNNLKKQIPTMCFEVYYFVESLDDSKKSQDLSHPNFCNFQKKKHENSNPFIFVNFDGNDSDETGNYPRQGYIHLAEFNNELCLRDIRQLPKIDPDNSEEITALIKLIERAIASYIPGKAKKYGYFLGLLEENQLYLIVELIDRLGDCRPGNTQALEFLVSLLKNAQDEFIAERVGIILEKIAIAHSLVLQMLTDMLEPNYRDFVRLYSASTLCKIDAGNQNAISTLIEVLKFLSIEPEYDDGFEKEDLNYASIVIDIFEKFAVANNQVIKAMVDFIPNSFWWCRKIPGLLGKIAFNNPEAIKGLTNLISSHQTEETYFIAAVSLLQINPENSDAIQRLTNLVDSAQERHIRTKAAYELREIGKLDNNNWKAIKLFIDEICDFRKGRNWRRSELCQFISKNENIVNKLLQIILDTSLGENFRIQVIFILKNNIVAGNNPRFLETLNYLVDNESNAEICRLSLNTLLSRYPKEPKLIEEAIKDRTQLFNASESEECRLDTAASLQNIDPNNLDALNVIIDVLLTSQDWFDLETVDDNDNDYIITARTKKAAQLLKKVHHTNILTVVVTRLQRWLIEGNNEPNYSQRSGLIDEVLFHCALKMSYPKFFEASVAAQPSNVEAGDTLFVANSAIVQSLENRLKSRADRLESTEKTQLLWIDARTLQSQTDFSAIAQELCTQIYLAANDGIPPCDVDSAVKLKPRILQIRAFLQKENLALILAECEPHDRLVEFFQEQLLPGLTQFLHVAWISSRPLEAPLKAFPEQENLLSAIQSWINELG